MSSAKLDYPATHRNSEAIAEVLAECLDAHRDPRPQILEIASGSGQHARAIAATLLDRHPQLQWQPSDPSPECRASIDAWIGESEDGLQGRVAAAVDIDTRWALAADGWPQLPSVVQSEASYDLLVCINMIHIAPWDACLGLLQLAQHVLRPEGRIYLYGPFMIDGRHHARSNAEFSASLQARNPDWGVRDLDAVEQAADARGFEIERVVAMPANNHSVVLMPNSTRAAKSP